MNIDSKSQNRTDTSSHAIPSTKSTHSHSNHLNNSNDIHIINTNENRSKSKPSTNKYFNHYYSNHSHAHSHSHSHGHPHVHHAHSHSTPLAHTKSHTQRHHRSTNKHHAHNGHAPNSSSFHQPSFFYKSHHNHNNHHNHHNNKPTKKAHHHHRHSQSAQIHAHQHRHGANCNESAYANHKLQRRQHPPQETLSDSEMMDLSHNNKHHQNKEELKLNGNRKQMESTKATTGDNSDENVTLSALHIKDVDSHGTESSSATSDSDDILIEDFKPAFPVKAIAFDLDKTMVRTISLHTNEQPQPEQHPNSYFMFFDEDTKEYHHVYKRPYLKKLLEFLSSEIVTKNRCKMMLCTHGTQKYAQTILEKCNADQLFPLMLPRKDWCRRKFEDDYKPRRFKTLEKMAKSVNERTEDIIMIDDDPGVYSKGDRCNGSLLHIKPFDDPYEQRNDNELNKLISFLAAVLKYGKNYYNKIFAKSIRYTGLVRSSMNVQHRAKHSLLRAQLLQRLIYDFNIMMDKQERLGTLFLFDRYCTAHDIDWKQFEKNKTHIAYYLLLLFGCLFIARQYLYTDAKRPKQFRRDPYSAEIWLFHVDLYIKIVKKYKTMNGVSVYDPQSSKHHKHHYHHSHSQPRSHHHHHHQHKHRNHAQAQSNNNDKQQQSTISMNDHQLITSYTGSAVAPLPPSANHHNHHHLPQQQHMTMSYHSHSHHRRKRKHKHREKQIYFIELHNITKQICGAIGYPKLLHGLYHRPKEGYDSSLFVKYESYVESLFHHIEIEKTSATQNSSKFD